MSDALIHVQTLLGFGVITEREAESASPLIEGTAKIEVAEGADFAVEAARYTFLSHGSV